MPMPFRRGQQPTDDPDVDLDDVLSSYEVTRVVSAEPTPTGLPHVDLRSRAVAPAAAAPEAAAEGDADDEGAPAPESAVVAEANVALIPGESLDLEVVDLDGTGYLFRGVVIGSEDTSQVAISARSADELQGWDVLTSGAQVVAVVQRGEESWLLTTRILGTSWAEAAAVVDLQPLRRALSTGRRVHQRVTRTHHVALPADMPNTRAATIDLSPGGAAIEVTGGPTPPAGPFDLILLLPEPTEVRAIVNGSRPGATADSLVWHVQFVVVPATARKRLIAATA